MDETLFGSQAFAELFRTDCTRSYYHWVDLLTEQLSDCCRVFDGDLQSMLILSIIGQSHFSALLTARNPDEAFDPHPPAESGLSASRISELSGIPRQTVRRKLETLARQGWIEKDARSRWSIRRAAAGAGVWADLFNLEQRTIHRIARFMAQLNRLQQDHARLDSGSLR
jgi:hypothetical protein